MYNFKEFLYHQRKPELLEPYILISENITDKLYEFIQDIDKLSYNPEKAYTYFGEVRRFVEKFNIYWNFVVGDCDEAIQYLHERADKNLVLKLINRTKAVQRYKQDKFRISFKPVTSPLEQTHLNEIEELFEKRLIDLDNMEKEVESFRYDREVREFCRYHVDLSLRKKVESLSCTHLAIAMKISVQSVKIKASLESVIKILKKNQKILLEEFNKREKRLLDELYDLNKYRLELTRKMENTVSDVAQEDRSILRVTNRIKEQAQESQVITARVQAELAFWEKRYSDFLEIYQVITKCQDELDKMKLLKETIAKMREENRLFNVKYGCKIYTFDEGGLLDEHEKHLDLIWKNVSRTLISFFTIRGFDQVEYKDSFGTFNMDDFGHKLYYFHYGDTAYHTDCYGNFYEPVVEEHKFDQNGRYFIDEEGEKVYQCAICTSKYKLDENGLLQKITKDCGHSEVFNALCKMNTTVPVLEIFPDLEPVDFKNVLNPEAAEYLRDSLGHILPEALVELFKCSTKNPVTTLAHLILKIGYKDGCEKIRRQHAKESERIYYEEKNKKLAEVKKEERKRNIKRSDPKDFYEDANSKLAYLLLWEKNDFDNIVSCTNMS